MTKMDIKREMESYFEYEDKYMENYGLYLTDLREYTGSLEDAILDYINGSVDVYTSDLKNWLANEPESTLAMNEVIEEGLIDIENYELGNHIRMAQAKVWISEAYNEMPRIRKALLYMELLGNDYIPNDLMEVEKFENDIYRIEDIFEIAKKIEEVNA